MDSRLRVRSGNTFEVVITVSPTPTPFVPSCSLSVGVRSASFTPNLAGAWGAPPTPRRTSGDLAAGPKSVHACIRYVADRVPPQSPVKTPPRLHFSLVSVLASLRFAWLTPPNAQLKYILHFSLVSGAVRSSPACVFSTSVFLDASAWRIPFFNWQRIKARHRSMTPSCSCWLCQRPEWRERRWAKPPVDRDGRRKRQERYRSGTSRLPSIH